MQEPGHPLEEDGLHPLGHLMSVRQPGQGGHDDEDDDKDDDTCGDS